MKTFVVVIERCYCYYEGVEQENIYVGQSEEDAISFAKKYYVPDGLSHSICVEEWQDGSITKTIEVPQL